MRLIHIEIRTWLFFTLWWNSAIYNYATSLDWQIRGTSTHSQTITFSSVKIVYKTVFHFFPCWSFGIAKEKIYLDFASIHNSSHTQLTQSSRNHGLSRYRLTSFSISMHIPSQPQIHIHYDCMNDIRFVQSLLLYSIKKRDTSPHPLVLFVFYFFVCLLFIRPPVWKLYSIFIASPFHSAIINGGKCRFPSGTIEKLLRIPFY